MDVKQLELDLELVLEDAAESPAIADLADLWQQIEPLLAQLSVQEQLRCGGSVIDQLAALHQTRANLLLDDWENTYDPQDPTLPGDWLQGFVRQSQHVDLSTLTAPAKRRPKGVSSSPKSTAETVVSEVSKADLLRMLDQVEEAAQKAAVLSVAHEENIQEWVAILSQWFADHPYPIRLCHLQHQLRWPLVQLWLSLLLGGFGLTTEDSAFYSSAILVTDRST